MCKTFIWKYISIMCQQESIDFLCFKVILWLFKCVNQNRTNYSEADSRLRQIYKPLDGISINVSCAHISQPKHFIQHFPRGWFNRIETVLQPAPTFLLQPTNPDRPYFPLRWHVLLNVKVEINNCCPMLLQVKHWIRINTSQLSPKFSSDNTIYLIIDT